MWNRWDLERVLRKMNYYDDRVETNDPDELLYGRTPTEILNAVDLDNYSLNDDWVQFTIYGMRSFQYPSIEIDMDSLIEYICDYEDSLENQDLQDILDEYDEDEEEDDEE